MQKPRAKLGRHPELTSALDRNTELKSDPSTSESVPLVEHISKM